MRRIYTKTGDEGETGLFGGARVPKDDPRVAAYGEVDELNAAIGFAASLEPAPPGADAAFLEMIQRDLFTIGAELASPDPTKVDKALGGPRIGPPQVGALEHMIDGHEAKLAPLKNFILPGGTPRAAAFHLARTVCRRAERAVVSLARREAISPDIVIYLNRLSDFLFVLARSANTQAGRPDVQW
jgi:cob(I)alamin adenosyltransferase